MVKTAVSSLLIALVSCRTCVDALLGSYVPAHTRSIAPLCFGSSIHNGDLNHHLASAGLKNVVTSFSSSTISTARFLRNDIEGFDENDDESDDLVTKEMLQRDMLADPKVKRKKRNGKHYRTLDNRDSLPFTVQVMTPDPYTKPELKKKEARNNTIKARKGKKPIRRKDLVGMDGIASSIYTKESDGTLNKVLGQFSLDKSTNCGDVIEVGDSEYVVQKARCQYKYAGGKRFVMVRKILEVKDVTRAAQESSLKRQLTRSIDGDVPPLEK